MHFCPENYLDHISLINELLSFSSQIYLHEIFFIRIPIGLLYYWFL
jgi:hypothetical protein